jgi:hypothetical protein
VERRREPRKPIKPGRAFLLGYAQARKKLTRELHEVAEWFDADLAASKESQRRSSPPSHRRKPRPWMPRPYVGLANVLRFEDIAQGTPGEMPPPSSPFAFVSTGQGGGVEKSKALAL